MSRALEERVGRALAAWVDRVCRRPGVAAAALLLATLAIGLSTVGRLGVNADTNMMFSSELPHRVVEMQYWEVFPNLFENIVIVVDGPTPGLASQAATVLAERMRAGPEHFHSVFQPRGPFFEEHALLYMDTAELEDFADRMARVQPYLAALAEDGSLRGLAGLMGRGVHGVREGEVGGEVLVPVLGQVGEAMEAWLAGESHPFSWAEVVASRELDADDRRQFIFAQPVLDFSDVSPARAAIAAVHAHADELGLDAARGYRVRMTGDVALADEEMLLVERQSAAAGLASFVMVSAILLFALRSVRMVIATITTLVAGLVWTAGFAAWGIGHLNLISAAFAVLYIGLAVDFGLHFCMRYQELRRSGDRHRVALHEATRGVGSSLALCAVTTAIGFFAFAPTDFSGVAELGIIAGTGMFISVFLAFSLLPALMTVGLRAGAEAPALPVSALPSFPMRYPRLVGVGSLLLGAAAVLLLPRVSFDQNPLRVRDPGAESVQILEELLAEGTNSGWEVNAVAPDLASAEVLAARLSELEVVSHAITVSDYVPTRQEEKLAIIEDVAMFLAPPPLEDGLIPPPGLADQLAAMVELRDELDRWGRAGIPARWSETVEGFRTTLAATIERLESSSDPAASLATLEEMLMGTLGRQLDALEKAIRARPVTLETLPAELVNRMVSVDGRVRVQIFPAEDLGDNAAMARFVDGVREVEPAIEGGAVRVLEASRAVVKALRQAFAAAIVVIALLLFLIWRTLGDTALVLTPLALAGIFTAAAAVLIGIPFNFADVIVLPLLLGIGVDSGIHLVHRAHMLGPDRHRLLATSTARAVVFSSITTIASFGTLAFASHRGMASLGQLLTLGVALTAACNLLVLPALIEWRERRRTARTPRSEVLASRGA